MNLDVRSLGFPCTTALSDHVERRLQFALIRHGNRIQRVVVRLGDENGPRGGLDKFCRIQVHLSDAPIVLINDIGPDLYAVIDRAAERAGRAVVKHLDLARSRRREAVIVATTGPDAATELGETERPGA